MGWPGALPICPAYNAEKTLVQTLEEILDDTVCGFIEINHTSSTTNHVSISPLPLIIFGPFGVP